MFTSHREDWCILGKRPGKRASDAQLRHEIWRLIWATRRKQLPGITLKVLTRRLRVGSQRGESSQQRLARLIKEMEAANRIKVVSFAATTVLAMPSWHICRGKGDLVVASATDGPAEVAFDLTSYTRFDVYAQLILHYLVLSGGEADESDGITAAIRLCFGLRRSTTVQPAISAALRQLREEGLVPPAPEGRKQLTELRLLKDVRPGLGIHELLALLPGDHKEEGVVIGDTHSILEGIRARRRNRLPEEAAEPAAASDAPALPSVVQSAVLAPQEVLARVQGLRQELAGCTVERDALRQENTDLKAKTKAQQEVIDSLNAQLATWGKVAQELGLVLSEG